MSEGKCGKRRGDIGGGDGRKEGGTGDICRTHTVE